MVSTLNLDEKYNRVRRNFCFYLDIQDHSLARSISRRIQDVGLQQEVFLTSRVSHVVRDQSGAGGSAAPARCARRDGRRADAMLDRVRASHHPPDHHQYVTLTVQKAINLLDKLYDTFFAPSRKSHVRLFTKHFIKIEFLDKSCRPVFKEFDEWPSISLDPDPPREKKDKKESPENLATAVKPHRGPAQKMTRRGRARARSRSSERAGYCEMCNTEYADAGAHRRSPHHRAFVRDAGNYLALDELIAAGADVAALLGRAERRADTHYYKVVGVGAKLRSGARRRGPPPANGAAPLVVKFRKVRRSELSVLSDEAEQFMFPRRASSPSSTDTDEKALSPKRKSPARPPPAERRRLARPLALKEDSSEEDAWPEDSRRRKRRAPPAVRRARRPAGDSAALGPPVAASAPAPEPEPAPPPAADPAPAPAEPPADAAPVSPLREADRCMRWEDGRLKYTPAVEQLEFAFESVPRSEPWYETFRRQDCDEPLARNVPRYFALYSTASPKLPYEIGQLPPLQPNCCPLSELVKQREQQAGPARAYGTRGMKKQKLRKRTAALAALDGRPRKSPREHASTLAILGSAGLLARRKPADDAKSTASEETASETHGHAKAEPAPAPSPAAAAEPGEAREASERLRRFLSDVFSEAAELELCESALAGAPAPGVAAAPPDVSSLLSECDACDLLRDQLRAAAAPRARRARLKRKNRTGWPNKKRQKKDSRAGSSESERRPGSEADDTTRDALSEPDSDATEAPEDEHEARRALAEDALADAADADSSDKLLIDLKVVVDEEKREAEKREARKPRSAGSSEERELRKRRRALAGLCGWLQPVVRVARVQPAAGRRLRSAARPRPPRLR